MAIYPTVYDVCDESDLVFNYDVLGLVSPKDVFKGQVQKVKIDLGTGKDYLDQFIPNTYKICVDGSYTNYTSITKEVSKKEVKEKGNFVIDLVGMEIFEFLEAYKRKDVDSIYASRVFEHIPREKISYLLYLCWSVAEDNCTINVIVPDFAMVLKSLDNISTCIPVEFETRMIRAHTEIFNEEYDPHRSIWTPEIADYYFNLEGYWNLKNINHVMLDGRNWYLSIEATVNK